MLSVVHGATDIHDIQSIAKDAAHRYHTDKFYRPSTCVCMGCLAKTHQRHLLVNKNTVVKMETTDCIFSATLFYFIKWWRHQFFMGKPQ
jgi:hypothetical protein